MKPYLYSLPPAWQWQELGEVATLINGRAYKDDELLESGPVPVLRVGNFFSNRSWYYSDLQLPEDKYCNKGDLLYAWSASFGPKIWDGEKAIFHYHIWKILTSPLLDKKYLYYLLASESANIKSAGNGIAMMHATKGGMEKRKIPLPPLAEQQKIAAILDAADSLRQKDQQLVERYTALSQSLFLEMFGDPVTNPMGWEKEELGSLAKISSGSTPSRDMPENYDGNIPWVKTGEVNGTNITRTSECISEEALANSSCKLYPSGSLIIAMYGQGKTRGQIGRLGIEAATNQACAVIPPSSKMNYDFLFSLLKLSYEDLRSLGRGGNQPNLNSGLIKTYSVISPPIALQNQFAERIQLIEAQKQQAQASLEKSEALFNSLLQRAFTGELTAKMAA